MSAVPLTKAPAGSPYDACLAHGMEQVRVWVPAWLGRLQRDLQQKGLAAGHGHEKHALSLAVRTLADHRDLIASRFFDVFGESLARSGGAAAGSTAAPVRKRQAVSFDDLELMDEQQVQETVDLARVQQVVKMAADDELAALSARLSRALGLEVVRTDANPFRPEEIVSALARVVSTLHVDESVRSRWLNAGAVSLGEALQVFYRSLDDLLASWGVAPAGYAVIQAPESRGVSTDGSRRTESVPAETLVGRDALLTLDHLHQLLVGNLENNGGAVSDQGASGSGNAMVRTLAAEVVTLLLRRISEDKRLQAPVRHLILELKGPMLRLARSDPRFFADRMNPARRLLDAVTARSLAFASEQDYGFEPFARQLSGIVQALQAPGPHLAERFPEMLARFNESHLPVRPPMRELAVKTLVRIEQRNLLAQKVASELEARSDFARAPGVVRRFLSGAWSLVVAHARFQGGVDESDVVGEAPALRYMAIVPDLLWSSQLVLASRNRPRLIKMIPRVLRTLREGLDAIEYPRLQAEAFFQALMGLHEAAYKTQHTDAALPGEVGTAVEVVAGLPVGHTGEPWMQSFEVRDSGFLEAQFIETEPAFLESESRQSDLASIDADATVSDTELLPVGAWVELREDNQTLRCQLSWASPHGTMYLFTTTHGRSISLTRRGMERLFERRRLLVVAGQGMVDEALNELTQQAFHNSVEG